MKVCPVCGDTNDDWMSVCQRCGHQLMSDSELNGDYNNYDQAPVDDYSYNSGDGYGDYNDGTDYGMNGDYTMNQDYTQDMMPTVDGSYAVKTNDNKDLKIVLAILLVILVIMLIWAISVL